MVPRQHENSPVLRSFGEPSNGKQRQSNGVRHDSAAVSKQRFPFTDTQQASKYIPRMLRRQSLRRRQHKLRWNNTVLGE